jgi:amino acid transporter
MSSGVNVRRLLIGKRLKTADLAHQAISRPIGLAVFASDALSSTAYATEEILIILALAGTSAAIFNWSIPIAIAIAILLAIVTISYRQTIYAYPNGGGAYIVARDNLGELPAQIAGAALLTDYILTVAVSISAGVAQITSGFPELLPYKVDIAIAVIAVMTIVNLRGVKESGRIFAVPTYFFLGVMFTTLVVGLIKFLTGSLDTVHDVEPVHHATQSLGLFLVLRAFSSGCTALTGIEAISNGIPAFKQPRSHNAAVTLMWMSTILITLFLGITLLAHQIEAVPSEEETVISQMGRTIYGEGTVFYILTLAGTALILLMAANTSYADFPRLAALQAGDGFLPRQLTHRGSRLVFSWGILTLSGFASLLVIIFDASTTNLIPLYAVGVFMSFTISQSGMVHHLWKIGKLKPGETIEGLEATLEYDKNWRLKMGISAFGATCTGIVMMVFAITKFTSGAWFVVLLIPTLVFIFFRIHNHYKWVANSLSLSGRKPDVNPRPVKTVILVDDVHAETARMVNFAKSLGHPWKAIHVGTKPEKVKIIQQKWADRIGEGELVIIPSPYRLLSEPIQEYIHQLHEETPGSFVHIIMGHLVMDTYWEQALHQNSAFIFNFALSRIDNVVVTSVPYQIHHPENDEYENGKNGNGKNDTDHAKIDSVKPDQSSQDNSTDSTDVAH